MADKPANKPAIDALVDDCLDCILDCLPAKDLASCELAWTRFRHVVVSGRLWKRAVWRLHGVRVAGLPSSDDGADSAASSSLWRRLAYELDAPEDRLSLLAHALGASSTDRADEAVANTLVPRARPRRDPDDARFRALMAEMGDVGFEGGEDDSEGDDDGGGFGGGFGGGGGGAQAQAATYWSSAGSASPGPPSAEWVAYRTVAPLVLATALTVRPFRAWFQPGQPVYAPASVQLCAGGDDLWAGWDGTVGGGRGGGPPAALPPPPSSFDPRAAPRAAAEAAAAGRPSPWAWATPPLPVARHGAPQRLALPRPGLLAGGHAHLALGGATQAQAIDNLYYTCLAHVALHGRAVRGLGLKDGGATLTAIPDVVARTPRGLAALSEGGRMAAKYARAEAKKAELDYIVDRDFAKMVGSRPGAGDAPAVHSHEHYLSAARALSADAPERLARFMSDSGSDSDGLGFEEWLAEQQALPPARRMPGFDPMPGFEPRPGMTADELFELGMAEMDAADRAALARMERRAAADRGRGPGRGRGRG